MATGDNTRLPQAATTGDLTATNKITGGVADGAKVQRIKLGFGADGSYADVEGSNPLPVAGAVTVAGVATATAQATAQTALDAIKVATEAGATATGQTTSNTTLASILSGLAALASATGQASAQSALDAIKAAVEGTIGVAGIVDVASLPAVTISALPNVTIGAAIPAGSNAIGSVSVSSLPNVTIGAAVPAGDNNIGNVDIVSLPSLPAGSNAIGTVTVTSAPLPSDAATQTTLAAILAALPAALGQALAAACMPVVLPVAQDVVAYAGVNGAIKFRPSIVASDKQSSLAATGKLITATGAALYYYVKNSSGGAIFLQIFNSATQPSTGDRADGYTVSISNGGLSNGAFGQNTHGIPCPNGVYLVASSTQDTYTPIVSTAVLYTAIYLQG